MCLWCQWYVVALWLTELRFLSGNSVIGEGRDGERGTERERESIVHV